MVPTIQKLLDKALDLQTAGKTDQAARLYRQVLKKDALNRTALYSMAHLEFQEMRFSQTIEILRKYLAKWPNHPDAANLLGIALRREGRETEAVDAFMQALQVEPRYVPAHINLGNGLFKDKHFGQALRRYHQALTIQPRSAATLCLIGNTLASMGRAEDAVVEYRSALALDSGYQPAHSSLLLFSHSLPDDDPDRLCRAHTAWGDAFQKTVTVLTQPLRRPEPARQLKVGFLSPDLHTHSVSYFLEPLLANFDRSEWNVTCYHQVVKKDATTRRLQARVGRWREVNGLNDPRLAELIARDKIDILVDVAGHTRNSRMRVLAWRPAPIQVTWLGYPNGTGLPTVDFRLTDKLADPEGAEAHYREKLHRLPHGFLCYRPPDDAPSPSRPPVLEQGFVTFGCFNHISKLNRSVIKLWAGLLGAVPNARLLLKADGFDSETVRDDYRGEFARQGVAGEKLILTGRIETTKGHLDAYNRVDIALDPFPYNGTTTTCEALWMGVPVFSLAGTSHASRVGLTLLTHVGHPEWAVSSSDAFVQRCAELAADAPSLVAIRRELRSQFENSSLRQEAEFTRAMEQAFRGFWQEWCTRNGG